MSYQEFLDSKRVKFTPTGIQRPGKLNKHLFPFQRDIVRWALKLGRAAIWADCGLGKALMALEWSRVITRKTKGKALILTPLAVAQQFVTEGEKFGIPVNIIREQDDVGDHQINVINYQRLHLIDPSEFVAVVADESSILKDHTAKTRNLLIEAFEATSFKLCCTATPSPNDHMELGNHAEFLGAMTRSEMLAMFFVHDGGETQKWRLKGHAQEKFWLWISSWAVSLRKPSDLGYEDAGFDLPALNMLEHIVKLDNTMARDAGFLFALEARTLQEQRATRRASMAKRVQVAADMANASDEPWLIWCELNTESSALTKAIPDAVEVKGADSLEEKEARMHGFTSGKHRVLVTKPKIAGWGMNWQHCANVAFVGISHSFEQWYQAIRRTYRFGQDKPVNCHMIISSADGHVKRNLARKQREAEEMSSSMLANMSELNRANLKTTSRTQTSYQPRKKMILPSWLRSRPEEAA